ncbi:MAG: hypothetical protein KKF56_05640 [Nanoarchaeota archaeon]|nr:hypothetical protein [Nanoarchaeota archaeon]
MNQEVREWTIWDRLLIWGSVAIFVFLIILVFGILDMQDKLDITDETAQCIADKSLLYVSTTCSHCIYQKSILKEHLELFNIIDCNNEPSRCKGISIVPSWWVDDKLYEGKQTWRELKELTGC